MRLTHHRPAQHATPRRATLLLRACAVVGIGGLCWSGSLIAADTPATAADQLINTPGLGAVTGEGVKQPSRVIRDPAVQGGQALRVVIPGADKQAWRISLGTPITKPVHKGDRLLLAYYARVEQAESAQVDLPYNAIQLAHEPYSSVINGTVRLGAEWKMQNVSGVADRDYAAGELAVSIHLATGKQILRFGPVFAMDLGPAA